MKNTDKLQAAWNEVAARLKANDDPQAIIADLVSNYGAKFRRGDPHTLRLAGHVATCTSSLGGLLNNWKSSAGLKLIMANQG